MSRLHMYLSQDVSSNHESD